MSGETKELYKRTWQAILSNEIYSENLRQKLNNKPLYKVWDAFQKSEISGVEIADIDSFRDLLNRNRVYPSEKQLVDLVSKYDKNHDGAVSYRDFEREVSPRSPRGRGYGY